MSQSVCFALVYMLRICTRVELKCSTSPSVCGWYELVLNLLIVDKRHTSVTNAEVKFDPKSDSRYSGAPWRGMILVSTVTLVKG
jgi:hypothetical protein